MSVGKALGIVSAGIVALAFAGGNVSANIIPVPNGSFESPALPVVPPYASPVISTWQKAAAPAWWLGSGYTAEQWDQSVGVFVNVGGVANADQNQLAFMFATPGVELYQDLPDVFRVGYSYHLSIGAVGGGYGMKLGIPMEIRLYYRDPNIDPIDERVTVGALVITNTNPGPVLDKLTDYQLDIPVVSANDPWAGRNIGIQIIQTVSFADAGGYWDLDNVRLVALPEPGAVGVMLLGAAGLVLRRRRA